MAGHYSFGAGRRACAGFRVAQNSMSNMFSRLIYCFDVAEDPVSNDESPSELRHSPYSSLSGPWLIILQANAIDTYHIRMTPLPGTAYDPPFSVKVTVRSEAHRQLILRECKGNYTDEEVAADYPVSR